MLLTIMDSAAVNIFVQFLCVYVFISSGYIVGWPKTCSSFSVRCSEKPKHTFWPTQYLGVELLGHVVINSMFNFLRNYQDVFQNNSIILHSHWQHIKVLVSPLLHECLLLSAFLIIYIPSRYDMLFPCGCDLHFLKEISPGCSLEGLMLKLKLQYFGHLM